MNGMEGADREWSSDDPWTRLRENATAVASMLVTAFWLGAMFTGQDGGSRRCSSATSPSSR